MEMTNTGDLSINAPKEYPVIEDGTYPAVYKGYKPFKEDGQWGHKEGVRLQFQIGGNGPFKGQYVSFKGNFFQDNQSGKWIIGSKSKLAEAIRVITSGETLNKGHEGTQVYVIVTVNTTKTGKNAGKRYSNVSMVLALPKDYSAPAPAAQPAPAQQPAAVGAPTTQQTSTPAKNKDLLDDLSDLSDIGN